MVSSIALTAKTQLVFARPSSTETAGKRPNILVTTGDDFNYSDIGYFGCEISSPNLDILTRDDKILTNYHTNLFCSPHFYRSTIYFCTKIIKKSSSIQCRVIRNPSETAGSK
jgi:hypothetical protein